MSVEADLGAGMGGCVSQGEAPGGPGYLTERVVQESSWRDWTFSGSGRRDPLVRVFVSVQEAPRGDEDPGPATRWTVCVSPVTGGTRCGGALLCTQGIRSSSWSEAAGFCARMPRCQQL